MVEVTLFIINALIESHLRTITDHKFDLMFSTHRIKFDILKLSHLLKDVMDEK